jgi:hypothetical protein
VDKTSRCNCDDTVKYDGWEKNSSGGAGLEPDGAVTTGAMRNVSPAPSQSFDVNIGVCV